MECSICMGESVRSPVVTCCGHLFCWPCIFKWLDLQQRKHVWPRQDGSCPVCKGALSLDSADTDFTPVYNMAGGDKDQSCEATDCRMHPRPSAARREPVPHELVHSDQGPHPEHAAHEHLDFLFPAENDSVLVEDHLQAVYSPSEDAQAYPEDTGTGMHEAHEQLAFGSLMYLEPTHLHVQAFPVPYYMGATSDSSSFGNAVEANNYILQVPQVLQGTSNRSIYINQEGDYFAYQQPSIDYAQINDGRDGTDQEAGSLEGNNAGSMQEAVDIYANTGSHLSLAPPPVDARNPEWSHNNVLSYQYTTGVEHSSMSTSTETVPLQYCHVQLISASSVVMYPSQAQNYTTYTSPAGPLYIVGQHPQSNTLQPVYTSGYPIN